MNGFGFMRDAFAHEFEGTPAVSRAPGWLSISRIERVVENAGERKLSQCGNDQDQQGEERQ